MDVVLLLVRLLLAAVFAVAGVTKLADLPGSRAAMRGFGVPERLAAPAGIALPLAELLVAVALLPLASAWWGALGTLALLLTFVAGIAYNLGHGRTPDCHCFGQVHSAPAGWSTLTRNGVLAALAAFLVFQGPNQAGNSTVGWLSNMSAGERVAFAAGIAGGVLLVVEGWVLFQVLRQNGRLLRRLDALEASLSLDEVAVGASPSQSSPSETGLPVGTPAPGFSVSGIDGEVVTLDALRADRRPVVLIFTDPNCGPCNALMPDIGRWQREHARELTVALVSRGEAEANAAKSAEHGLSRVFLQRDWEVSEAYQSLPTPSAVLIRPDGRVGTRAALGSDAIRALVARATGTPVLEHHAIPDGNGDGSQQAEPPPSRVGTPAPALTLPDLSDTAVSLVSFQGQRTLVLFWDPRCGYCARMLEELKAWEAAPPTGAPQLLVVSTGTAEANRAMGLRSTVVINQGFTGGRAFGARGTPSAVLVDADGMIASDVAVGAPAVFALANGSPEQARIARR